MTLTANNIWGAPPHPGSNAETYIPDQLIVGNPKLVTENGILASGTLQRGAVLGLQPSGNYVLSKKTEQDGSEIPSAILISDADASGGAVAIAVYLMGDFNQNALLPDSSWGADSAAWTLALAPMLRNVRIFLKPA